MPLTLKLISLLAIVLTLLSLAASSTETSASSSLDSGYANHTAEISTILSSREVSWRPGQSISIDLEPGMRFQICGANPDDGHMCYVSFVEKSTWGGWAIMWAFDNSCNLRGSNTHVARNWLNGIWFFSTDLPTFLQVEIKTWWNEDKNEGVSIYYNKHRTQPFVGRDYPVFTYKTRYPSKTPPGAVYAVFRAVFRC
ncbi:hypothetical protein ONS95_008411 [Cadophora gregata]|uniref:uncharacterized protein n=1 Tax=Cadophora gregata TaxID=51156 RepID=UPI0026DB0D83|nr:uncharacterized protein ONS95_008411 [Cadophora gregata]KAK0126832.1 hypothetical protein ONS95_008411 [Cadophora gregata]